MNHKVFIIVIFLIYGYPWSAQQDTIDLNKPYKKQTSFFVKIAHWSEPKKASMLSALFPGTGQMYNKKFWKVPVIYALGGLLTYSAIRQNNRYMYYKSELISVLNGGISSEGYSAQQLSLLKNESKRWRDLSIAGTALVYVLNILDAHVDAHLKTFDVSDDLTIQWPVPVFYLSSNKATAIQTTITLRFFIH